MWSAWDAAKLTACTAWQGYTLRLLNSLQSVSGPPFVILPKAHRLWMLKSLSKHCPCCLTSMFRQLFNSVSILCDVTGSAEQYFQCPCCLINMLWQIFNTLSMSCGATGSAKQYFQWQPEQSSGCLVNSPDTAGHGPRQPSPLQL